MFIPYTILTMIFDYPDILRQDAGVILTRFHEGGSSLILVWFLFAILGLPLILAYISIGQKLENKFYFVRWATTLGVISVVVQMIGLLRWTFVVPVLANNFVAAVSEATEESNKVAFLNNPSVRRSFIRGKFRSVIYSCMDDHDIDRIQ